MATYSLTPAADTYIVSGQGNQGSSAGVVAGQITIIASHLFVRALLRFDLTALAGLAILSASLRLSLSDAFFPEGPHIISLHETTTDWTELGATWTSAGGSNWGTAGGDYGAAFTTGTVTNGVSSLTFEVLQKVQQRSGGELNVIAVSPEDGALNHYFTAYSKETGNASLWATLTVVAVTPAGAPLQWNAPGTPMHWTEPAVELPPLEWSPITSTPCHWTA